MMHAEYVKCTEAQTFGQFFWKRGTLPPSYLFASPKKCRVVLSTKQIRTSAFVLHFRLLSFISPTFFNHSPISGLPKHLSKQTDKMVAAARSNKKPLPDMMTSIRLDQSGQVEIVDQLLLP